MRSKKFAVFAWLVIGLNLLVIVWGAYVRASGSGAGCGSHWPLCNGAVIPAGGATKTAIEFTHRIMSGLDLLAVIALVVIAFRLYPRRDPARRAASWSLFFIVTEALIGAGLVKLDLVAHNASTLRALFIGLHLANTFLLLASLALTAWLVSGGAAPRLRGQGAVLVLVTIALAALILVGASGAVTALGDTLFPAGSLAEGFQQDWSAGAHLFLRLRIIHPVLAGIVGCFLMAQALGVAHLRPRPATQRLSMLVVCLVATQFFVGLLNFGLLAPIGLQMTHLIVADLLWLSVVLLAAAALSAERQRADDPDFALSGRIAA
jgi:heme A synthase